MITTTSVISTQTTSNFLKSTLNSQIISKRNKILVCYYTNWSQYRPGVGRFVPENVDPFLCTHIIYAFAKVDEAGNLQPFEWNDQSTEWSRGMFDRTMDLKKKNPNLKILLAAGGIYIYINFNLFIKHLYKPDSLKQYKKRKKLIDKK